MFLELFCCIYFHISHRARLPSVIPAKTRENHCWSVLEKKKKKEKVEKRIPSDEEAKKKHKRELIK